MNEDAGRDFAELTLAACRELVGEDFVRPDADGPGVVLRLMEAERVRRDPRAAAEGDRPFSLLFRGPAEPRLTQGRHDLVHPRRRFPGLFLVPVAQDDRGTSYEAIFG